METYHPTKRVYIDVETKESFNLCQHHKTQEFKLISNENTIVNSCYLCACTPSTIKLNTGKIINLDNGEFYNLKEKEVVTHRKFCGFTKFTKIK